MAFEDRIASLRAKHRELELQLSRESRRPLPDDAIIMTIKKQKLRLKDEITRLSVRA